MSSVSGATLEDFALVSCDELDCSEDVLDCGGVTLEDISELFDDDVSDDTDLDVSGGEDKSDVIDALSVISDLSSISSSISSLTAKAFSTIL